MSCQCSDVELYRKMSHSTYNPKFEDFPHSLPKYKVTGVDNIYARGTNCISSDNEFDNTQSERLLAEKE